MLKDVEMLQVTIEYEYNENEVKIVQSEMIVGGKPEIEDIVRRTTDKAKAKFIAALREDHIQRDSE
jgi:hypothetical protein